MLNYDFHIFIFRCKSYRCPKSIHYVSHENERVILLVFQLLYLNNEHMDPIFLYARLQTGRIMVWWCPSVRPSGSPSIRPSVRPSQFSALFSYMLWDIELKFFVSLYFDARKIKFECHQFPSIFAGVMPLLNFKLLQICSFPHFSPTCFDILSWNFAYDFVLLYYRSSLSAFNLLQFLLELCPFWNVEYWKYTVFHTFLLHALIYWAEILHITLFYCTTYQVGLSSISVNFCRILPLLELRIREIHNFPQFFLTFFDILSWNFTFDFVLMYYRSRSSVVSSHLLL